MMAVVAERTCTIEDCGKPYVARGMCRTHYGQWYEKDHPRKDRSEWRREYEDRNRDKVRAWKRASSKRYRALNPMRHRLDALPRKYGITQTDYDLLLAQQGGTCALCDRKPDVGKHLDIDHDARTGVVRGLLCRSHNMGLGYFTDSPALLRRAAIYLEMAR